MAVAARRKSGPWLMRLGVGLSLALLLTSLPFPCYVVEGRTGFGEGIALLLIGWMGVFDGQVAWLANPLLLLGWCATFLRLPRIIGLTLTLLATGFALGFLLYPDILVNEAGHRAAITGYRTGYWLWVGSTLVALLAAVLNPGPTAAETAVEAVDFVDDN